MAEIKTAGDLEQNVEVAGIRVVDAWVCTLVEAEVNPLRPAEPAHDGGYTVFQHPTQEGTLVGIDDKSISMKDPNGGTWREFAPNFGRNSAKFEAFRRGYAKEEARYTHISTQIAYSEGRRVRQEVLARSCAHQRPMFC